MLNKNISIYEKDKKEMLKDFPGFQDSEQFIPTLRDLQVCRYGPADSFPGQPMGWSRPVQTGPRTGPGPPSQTGVLPSMAACHPPDRWHFATFPSGAN